VESFFKRDIRNSNENIESVKKLESLCEEINHIALQQKGAVAISIGYISERLIRTGEYAQNISESVINNLIGGEKIPL
jgi:hypothetical protein